MDRECRVSPLLLFSFRQGKCVLESPSQFGNTAVSCSSHLAKTADALVMPGVRRGWALHALSLRHKLLFLKQVLIWEPATASRSFPTRLEREGHIHAPASRSSGSRSFPDDERRRFGVHNS